MPKKIAFDYSKLRGRITEKYGTLGNFANALGVAQTSLSLKLNNKGYFTQEEIMYSCTLLEIDNAIPYFFTLSV